MTTGTKPFIFSSIRDGDDSQNPPLRYDMVFHLNVFQCCMFEGDFDQLDFSIPDESQILVEYIDRSDKPWLQYLYNIHLP